MRATARGVLLVGTLCAAGGPLRCGALPLDRDDWGAGSFGGAVRDLAVGTVAAGVAEGASAPLSTLRALLQTGQGLQSLHSKAVELLDTRGRPVKERGVTKMVFVPLGPVQTLARVFGTGVLTPASQAAGSVATGAVMVVFTRLAPALVRAKGWSDPAAGLFAALLAALMAGPLVAAGSASTTWCSFVVGMAVACRTLEHLVAAEMLRRGKEAEAWDARARWSSLRGSTLMGFESAGGRAIAVGVLHALVAAGSLPFEAWGIQQTNLVPNGKGATRKGAVAAGMMAWGPLKAAEFAVRGCVLHYLLMRGHAWIRGAGDVFSGVARLLSAGKAGERRRSQPMDDSEHVEGDGKGVREVGFRTMEQAKKQRVGEHEILVFDVPYDDEIGVDLPQVVLKSLTFPLTHHLPLPLPLPLPSPFSFSFPQSLSNTHTHTHTHPPTHTHTQTHKHTHTHTHTYTHTHTHTHTHTRTRDRKRV